MRIIAGRFKGRRLASPKHAVVRPTADRVRESYFRIVQNQIVGVTFLDLCAGSGAIGLEAFSRGAEQVFFLENDYRSVRLIKDNLEKCGVSADDHRIKLLPVDILRYLNGFDITHTQFQMIYFDPPYDSDFYLKCLDQVSTSHILVDQGIICVEHDQNNFPTQIGYLKQIKQKKYGNTRLSFFRMEK